MRSSRNDSLLNDFWLLLVAMSVVDVAQAHHSIAIYDTTKELTVEGVIIEAQWKNPHTYFVLEVTDDSGDIERREIEAGSIANLQPWGVTRDVLQPGKRVSLRAHPHRRDVEGKLLGLDLVSEDGKRYALHVTGRGATLPTPLAASGFAGQWLSPPDSFLGMFVALSSVPLSDEAKSLRADLGTLFEAQASCEYYPPPMLMVAPILRTIDIDEERIVFKFDGVGRERVVYLDGRQPALNPTPSPYGHSIGRWESATVLAIDTTGFAPSPEGIGMGIPGSSEKKLHERLSMTGDRRHIDYEMTVEDPRYLNTAFNYRALWHHAPNAEASGEECDSAIARKFLEQ